MKDKMRTIRATAELQHSILGHGKRTDADNYGEGELLRYLMEELIKADALTHWGTDGGLVFSIFWVTRSLLTNSSAN